MTPTREQLDSYYEAVLTADNATFMRITETTNDQVLVAIADDLRLEVDYARGRRMGPLAAVRKELGRRRRELAQQETRL